MTASDPLPTVIEWFAIPLSSCLARCRVKLNNLKNIFEVVGIAAVVASLIFVGMEIRQSQEIAVASQYQSRIEFNLGFFDAIDEQGFFATGERFKRRVSESNLPDESKQATSKRIVRWLLHQYQAIKAAQALTWTLAR